MGPASLWARACWHATRLCLYVGLNTTYLLEGDSKTASGPDGASALPCDGYSLVFGWLCRGILRGRELVPTLPLTPWSVFAWLGFSTPVDGPC